MSMHPLSTRFIAEIEILAAQEQCILWAMNKDMSQELFISATYQSLWQFEPVNMYRILNHRSLETYISKVMKEKKLSEFQNRTINAKHTIIYQIELPNGTLQLVQDRSFHLNDKNGNTLLIAGVAMPVSEDSFKSEEQTVISDRIDRICIELYRLLLLPLEKISITQSQRVESLTSKQKEVLKFILHGLNAKEIAKQMHLSFRTIESHTTQIKERFGASSKSELISIAISENLMGIFL